MAENIGIHVTGSSREAISEARDAISEILTIGTVEQHVRIEALKTLVALSKAPEHLTITGCAINMGVSVPSQPSIETKVTSEADEDDDF
jgi:hypothetical protein